MLHMAAWLSGNDIEHIGEVTLCQAQLVVRWVTVSGFSSWCKTFILVCDQPTRSTQPVHPFVGTRSEYQPKALMPCGWGVKACMVRVWGWQVQLCDPIVTHAPYLSALEIRGL